nr:RNA-directed DNA polymerase, eukaryota [Tanacetum cinerariifolium]
MLIRRILHLIGNGLDTSFWYDCWIDDSALHIKFPRLFSLELDKDISVAGKMNSQVTQSFRREPRGGIEIQQLTDLATLLDSVILNNSKDRWYCDLSGDGEFWVKELRNFIDDKYLPSHTEATRWVKLVPIKVNIFVWRARRDCLPTRTNLEHRGVDLFPVCVEACLSLVEFRPPRMVDISGMANLVPFASISI